MKGRRGKREKRGGGLEGAKWLAGMEWWVGRGSIACSMTDCTDVALRRRPAPGHLGSNDQGKSSPDDDGGGLAKAHFRFKVPIPADVSPPIEGKIFRTSHVLTATMYVYRSLSFLRVRVPTLDRRESQLINFPDSRQHTHTHTHTHTQPVGTRWPGARPWSCRSTFDRTSTMKQLGKEG